MRNAKQVHGALVLAIVVIGIAATMIAVGLNRTVDSIALGAYVADTSLGSPRNDALDRYAHLVGHMPALVMWYQMWGERYASFPKPQMDAARVRGAVPMVTWEPWGGNPRSTVYSLSSIVEGRFDNFIKWWAIEAKIWSYPFFLRFAQEMNGNWYPWGTMRGNPNGNTPADYVAAWRHVHDIFARVGATNAIWVWSPNTIDRGSTPYQEDYPGDGYVDWVGIDGYNVGTSQGWNGWTSFAQLFGRSYGRLAALTNKPMMIAETASTELGGNKAAWITRGFLNDIPRRFPRIRAVVWFDKNKETDWRVDSSPGALAAYRRVAMSPLYQGHLP